MGELLGELVFHTLFYATGKVVAQIFLPHLGIEPFTKQKSTAGWKWKGFTYHRGQQRYLYTESIQAIGALFLLLVGLVIWLFARFGV